MKKYLMMVMLLAACGSEPKTFRTEGWVLASTMPELPDGIEATENVELHGPTEECEFKASMQEIMLANADYMRIGGHLLPFIGDEGGLLYYARKEGNVTRGIWIHPEGYATASLKCEY